VGIVPCWYFRPIQSRYVRYIKSEQETQQDAKDRATARSFAYGVGAEGEELYSLLSLAREN
jgi:hypothetical protein